MCKCIYCAPQYPEYVAKVNTHLSKEGVMFHSCAMCDKIIPIIITVWEGER